MTIRSSDTVTTTSSDRPHLPSSTASQTPLPFVVLMLSLIFMRVYAAFSPFSLPLLLRRHAAAAADFMLMLLMP